MIKVSYLDWHRVATLLACLDFTQNMDMPPSMFSAHLLAYFCLLKSQVFKPWKLCVMPSCEFSGFFLKKIKSLLISSPFLSIKLKAAGKNDVYILENHFRLQAKRTLIR
uniref:Uncharacterized protein n=1 Tax=Sphaerodactylus townsendi TaxID=933632 RepID=A0ACB8FIZ1_9SAUR